MVDSAWIGINQAIAALAKMDQRVDAATAVTVVQAGALTEAKAKANFEGSHKRGEPRVPNSDNKPNIVTGTLRRSIRSTPTVRLAGGYSVMVGPTTEYGRRVELGFVGQDSLGRRYNQPPYPYFGPAVEEVRVEAHALAISNWAAATR